MCNDFIQNLCTFLLNYLDNNVLNLLNPIYKVLFNKNEISMKL